MNKLTAEKCREQFEEWLDKNSFNKNRNEMGAYEASFCQAAWIGWQASRDALPILEQQERGEGEWIELGEGAIPVHPETLVEIKMRNGVTDGPRRAGGFFWFKGNAVRDEMDCDIIAYRIIPERATNQNGEVP